VKLGKADGHQDVLGQNKSERRCDVFFLALVVRGDRYGDDEGAVLILKAAGEFDFLQLFARRDVELIDRAGAGNFLPRRVENIHPDRLAAGLMFCEHAVLLPRQ
jgi:hypothetical protein